MRHVSSMFGHLLTTFDQDWLQRDKLESYARSVFGESQALEHCWGFVDGTVQPICRSGAGKGCNGGSCPPPNVEKDGPHNSSKFNEKIGRGDAYPSQM